jgi:hypothetical protein
MDISKKDHLPQVWKGGGQGTDKATWLLSKHCDTFTQVSRQKKLETKQCSFLDVSLSVLI